MSIIPWPVAPIRVRPPRKDPYSASRYVTVSPVMGAVNR